MPISPSGHLSGLLDRLRTAIAASASFQAWVGAGSGAAALASVYVGQAPASATLPFAIVELPSGLRRRLAGRYDNNLFELTGRVIARFRQAVAGGTSDQDALYGPANTFGAIWADMEAAAGTVLFDGSIGLQFEESELFEHAQRPEAQEAASVGDFNETALRFLVRGVAP